MQRKWTKREQKKEDNTEVPWLKTNIETHTFLKEIAEVMKSLKAGKAPEIDGIPAEIFKNSSASSFKNRTVSIFYPLIGTIREQMSEEWKKECL